MLLSSKLAVSGLNLGNSGSSYVLESRCPSRSSEICLAFITEKSELNFCEIEVEFLFK